MKKINLTLLVACLAFQLFAQSPNANWTFHALPGTGLFYSIYQAKDGKIYVSGGLPNSIFRVYDGTSWTLYTDADTGLPSDFAAKDITVDSTGTVWLAGDDGFAAWDGQHPATLYNYANSNLNSPMVENIAVDQDNNKWLTSLQAFDDLQFETFDRQGCIYGKSTRVFVARNHDVWVSGTYTDGVDGMAVQPCVFRIANNVVTVFRQNNGDGIPHLGEGSETHHLIGELSDGTIFIVGRGDKLELKKFVNGTWVPWASISVSGTGVGRKFNTLWVDKKDNVLIGAKSLTGNAQIIKYCSGNFTMFNLPASSGFPLLSDILVDNQNNLWLVGNSSICSAPYDLTDCSFLSQNEPKGEALCQKIYYADGYVLVEGCSVEAPSWNFRVHNTVGQLIKSGEFDGHSCHVGDLHPGVYFVTVQAVGGREQVTKLFVD